MQSPASRDLIGRRSRMSQSSSGKRVHTTERDLLWFTKLAEHGPLPSSFLVAYSSTSHNSEKRAQERLTDLFHETNTLHGGQYLSRPPQQFRTIDSRYNQLVYDLAPGAKAALADAGVQIKSARSGPWLHSLMISCITASIELACIMREDLSYIPQSRILTRAGATLRWPTKITDPKSGATYTKDLISDAIFGLEYLTRQGAKFRFFAVEADRATEPATSTNFNRKSFDRHLQQYREYVERRLYQEHLSLTAPLLVLNVTTELNRMRKMMRLTDELFSGACNYQLFQCWQDFGPVFVPPKPFAGLLEEKWRLSARGSFNIGT